MEAQGHAEPDRSSGLSEQGLSGWPDDTRIDNFWCVQAGNGGWILMQSQRIGTTYSEWPIWGHATVPASFAIGWLIKMKEVTKRHGT